MGCASSQPDVALPSVEEISQALDGSSGLSCAFAVTRKYDVENKSAAQNWLLTATDTSQNELKMAMNCLTALIGSGIKGSIRTSDTGKSCFSFQNAKICSGEGMQVPLYKRERRSAGTSSYMHIFRREANTDGLRFLSDVFTVVELDGQRSSWDGKFGKLRQILLINGEVADTDDAAALSSKVLSRLIVKEKVNQWGRSTGMPNVEQLLQIHPSVLEGYRERGCPDPGRGRHRPAVWLGV
jgi:hypothetical protein